MAFLKPTVTEQVLTPSARVSVQVPRGWFAAGWVGIAAGVCPYWALGGGCLSQGALSSAPVLNGTTLISWDGAP